LIRKIITTSDGSKTIQIVDWNEQYHSIHGAIQEANHVFLKHGLLFLCDDLISKSDALGSEPQIESDWQNERLPAEQVTRRSTTNQNLSILEIGFGTGLNAFLTLIEAEKLNKTINYTGIEAYPVSLDEIEQLNYVALISENHADIFKKMHNVSWNALHQITSYFQLEKQQKRFQDIEIKEAFDIVYFDAFGARVQPDLWTEDIFKIMFEALKINGVLVTYSAKGSVRRAMQTVGFTVERLPGPPGKREMLRATKHSTNG
jgi:tRNA U34 5-methylaminomethyl-2-thiouridine-forming methyltransferase MnmC